MLHGPITNVHAGAGAWSPGMGVLLRGVVTNYPVVSNHPGAALRADLGGLGGFLPVNAPRLRCFQTNY